MTSAKPLHKRLLGPPYRWLKARVWRLHPRRFATTFRWLAEVAGAIRRRRRERRLTVAVDVRILWEPLTGIGWYLVRLLEELAGRPDLALRLYGPSAAAEEVVPPPVVPLPAGPALELVLYPTPEESLVHQDRLIRLLRRLERWLIAADGNRVVFAPNYLPSERFSAARGELVATIHDLSYRRVPWALRQETLDRLSSELDETWYRARRIITDSQAVRDEMVAEGLATPERIRVIPLGPGQRLDGALEGAEPPPDTPPDYALGVGTVEPRKNLETLLRAWGRLHRERSGAGGAPPLVLCGLPGWKSEGIQRAMATGRAEGWLHVLGYVDEAALAGLYRRARLFAFPSRYEGFGLPVLEAMAAGAPVVASDLPVLRELAGDAAAYVQPLDVEGWVRALARVLDDSELARRLGEAGRERARRYDWRQAAERHVAVFREVAGR